MDHLHGARHDAPENIAADRVQAAHLFEHRSRQGMQPIAGQGQARCRTQQVVPAITAMCIEGRRVLDLFLHESRLPVGRRDIQSFAGDHPPAVERVAAVGVAQRQEQWLPFVVGHREAAHPANRDQRVLERPLQHRAQQVQILARRHP